MLYRNTDGTGRARALDPSARTIPATAGGEPADARVFATAAASAAAAAPAPAPAPTHVPPPAPAAAPVSMPADGAVTLALPPQELARLPLPDDLIDWMGFIRRHWLLMIAVWVVAMVLIGLALYFWPRQYASEAKFLVKNARQDLVIGPSDGGTTAALQQQLSETILNTELELLRSRDILARVVSELHLEKPLLDAGYDPPVATEKAIGILGARLDASAIRKTNMIDVSYLSRDPELANNVVRHLSDAYLAAHLTMHSSPGTYDMFQQQVTAASDELRKAEEAVAAQARSENLVSLEAQKTEALTALQATEAQLNAVTAAIREQDTREKVAALHMETTPQRVPTMQRTMPNQQSVQQLTAVIVDLRNKRTDALMKFNPTDRFVKELDQQIADTTTALEAAQDMTANEESTDINPAWQQLETERNKARLELAGLESKAAALRTELEQHRRRVLQIAEASPAYDELTRKAAAAKSKYELLAKRQEEARLADVLDRQRISNVVLAQAPVVSHVPAKPNVRLGLVAGAMLASLAAVGSAFVREFVTLEFARRKGTAPGLTVVGIAPAPAESR